MRASHSRLLKKIAYTADKESTTVALGSGDTTITRPVAAKTQVMVFVPKLGETETFTLIGANAEVGVTLSNSIPSIIAVDSTDVALIINSTGATTATIDWHNEQ